LVRDKGALSEGRGSDPLSTAGVRPGTASGLLPGESFLVGANLPWVSYGGDFGASAWSPGGGLARPQARTAAQAGLAEVASRGGRLVRWWLFGDGRAGLRFDAGGRPLGLDDFVLADVDVALDLLRGVGLRAMFVLFDFLWCRPVRRTSGVSLGGHRSILRHDDRRKALIETVFAPLLSSYGREPLIHSWDIVNEPEWPTLGMGGKRSTGGVAKSVMRAFLSESVAVVHDLAVQPVTVGLASAAGLPLVQGLGLDYYQVHWYDSFERANPLACPCADLALDRPVLLGEFPTRGSRRSVPAILDASRAAGYAGALAWSVLADDTCSGWADAAPGIGEWARLAALETPSRA
jgi:hypothetical protein